MHNIRSENFMRSFIEANRGTMVKTISLACSLVGCLISSRLVGSQQLQEHSLVTLGAVESLQENRVLFDALVSQKLW